MRTVGAFGNGYMEVSSVSGPDRVARYVDTNRSVRQTFTPPVDLNATAIYVGAMHVSGANSMTVTLRDDGGAELASGTVSGFPQGTPSGDENGDISVSVAEFRGVSIAQTPLKGGKAYALEVLANGGSHTVVATRDGSLQYDYSPQSTVLGRAELRPAPNAPWEGWPVRNTTADDQFDLSFYFETD